MDSIHSRVFRIKEPSPKFLQEVGAISVPQWLTATEDPSVAPPASFSIKQEMSPAKNQGRAGTCTSFAVISCLDCGHG